MTNRAGHTLHLFGEPVPFGQNAFVLRQRTTICVERPQDLAVDARTDRNRRRNTLCFGSVRDSRISKCLTHGWSA
jgi:hypothetical protein